MNIFPSFFSLNFPLFEYNSIISKIKSLLKIFSIEKEKKKKMQPGYYYNTPYMQPVQYGYVQQPVMQTFYKPPEVKIQSLSVDVPIYDYLTTKTVLVPFDKTTSNNGMFTCLDDAMKYIGKHSKRYHGQFNRQLAKSYASFCRILDFVRGDYFPLSDVSKREFNNSFQRISKALE